MGMEAARGALWLLLVGALSLQAQRPGDWFQDSPRIPKSVDTGVPAKGYQILSHLSSYEITVPKRITREGREASSTSLAQDKLSYVIEIEGNEYIIHLENNKELLPKDFTVYTYGEDGKLRSQILDGQGHCHYQGYVEGISDSTAAISTCSGLRGLLQVRNITYGIEPMDSASGSRHLVYRMENVKKEPVSCGVADSDSKWESDTDHQHAPSMTQLLRRKRGVLLQTRYVELFIVVDNERYDMFGRNATAVREEMVQLANYLDSMYSMLNIRIVLVGLEIWTKENKIRLEGGAGDVLANFVQWRENELVSRRRHDSAQLVLKKAFGGTAGMAYVGTVCSKSHAGGINVFGQMSLQMFASIVAHELGHNLGMNHDDERDCSCETESCIMSSGASGARNFSSCSAEDFEKLTLNRGGSCLLNIPTPVETYSVPYCGNKLVDADEECDCGSPQECESDPCCEARTCKLKAGAACAYGDCCHNCHYLSKGTMCRESAGECDLPEYCNGSTAFCPQDVTMQNGHPCHQDKAYCSNGMCQYYDAQCRAIFGPKAKAAPEVCFSEVNSKGDRFGNCGYHGYEYKKCSSWNAMCGKLQCENVKTLPVFGIKPAIIQTPIKGNTCWGVDFQLGSDVPDPGMVNEGTKYAPGKVCKHFQCVDVAALDYDCDVGNKCNGRGVCNSNKNCHCDSGWAPPYCDNKGYGGSVDSGPPYNDLALRVALRSDKNSALPPKVLRYRRWSQQQNRDPYEPYEPKDQDNTTRNWLLAFFCLILPMLLVLLFIYIKRNQIVSALLPLLQSLRDCCRGSANSVQEPVHTDYPPSIPYSPQDTSSQVNWQSTHYPMPSQPYVEPYSYTAPIPSPLPSEQQFVPTRPPPPVLKTKTPGLKTKTQMTTQEHFFPSRPAPLPPK